MEKNPGCDGIPVDFYKMFQNKIKELYYGAVMLALDNDKMHLSARRGIINLTPQKNKDLNYMKKLASFDNAQC